MSVVRHSPACAQGVDAVNDDELTHILRFLPAYDLSTATHLSRRLARLTSHPSPSLSHLWRSLLSTTLHLPLPLLLQPPYPHPLTPTSYHLHLSFLPSTFPSAFTTTPMVTTRGHRHEMRPQPDWCDDDVWHDHAKVMEAVTREEQEARWRDGRGKGQGGEAMEWDAAEGVAVAAAGKAAGERFEVEEERESDDEELLVGDSKAEEVDGGVQVEGGEEEEAEEGEEDERDDNAEEDEEEEEEEEEDGEDEEVEGDGEGEEELDEEGDDEAGDEVDRVARLRSAQVAGVLRRMGFVDAVDDHDPVTTFNAGTTAPSSPAHSGAVEEGHQPTLLPPHPQMSPALRALLRNLLAEPVERAQPFLGIAVVPAEESRTRKRRREAHAELRGAWLDVGDVMEGEEDLQRSLARERRQQRRRERRWRRMLELRRRRNGDGADTSSSSEDEEETKEEVKTDAEVEAVCTRVRYSNNTQGGDRAITLNHPFPLRLPYHDVPFTVVERMQRQRYDEWLQRWESAEQLQMQPRAAQHRAEAPHTKRPADAATAVETEDARKKQKQDGAEMRGEEQRKRATRSSSSSSRALGESQRVTVVRLSMVAYFEVTIEREDAEATNRREREAAEATEQRRRERAEQRAQRIAAGEEVEADEPEVEARVQRQPHRFAGRPQCVSIGLATRRFPLLGKQPGWDRHSIGYHGDDGALFHGSGTGSSDFGPSFGAGDVVGCGLDYRAGTVLFTRNGREVGTARPGEEFLTGEWWGVVGLDSHAVVRVSTRGPFAFDVSRWEWETDAQYRRSARAIIAESNLRQVWQEQRSRKHAKEQRDEQEGAEPKAETESSGNGNSWP